MKNPVIRDTDVLAFTDYFRMTAELDEVLDYFGVECESNWAELPSSARALPYLDSLRERLEETLLHVSLTSEAARREVLIAPVVVDLVRYVGGRLRIEYPVDAGPQLHGSLDYLLQVERSLLVIEAKNADLARGMTQLAVELLAVDQLASETAQPLLYGSISTGTTWQIACFDRHQRRFIQNLRVFNVPGDLEALLRTLVGCVADS